MKIEAAREGRATVEVARKSEAPGFRDDALGRFSLDGLRLWFMSCEAVIWAEDTVTINVSDERLARAKEALSVEMDVIERYRHCEFNQGVYARLNETGYMEHQIGKYLNSQEVAIEPVIA